MPPSSSNFVIAWLIFAIAVIVSVRNALGEGGCINWATLTSRWPNGFAALDRCGALRRVVALKYVPGGSFGALVYKIAWGRKRGISTPA